MRSDRINSNSNNYNEYENKVVDITTATYTVLANESGTLFTLNKADGIAVTLPSAAIGLQYEFVIGTTFSSDLTITAASSADTYQGVIMNHDLSYLGSVIPWNGSYDTSAANLPAAADYILTLDAVTDGWTLGGYMKFTAVSASKWLLQGTLIGDGTVTHIFS